MKSWHTACGRRVTAATREEAAALAAEYGFGRIIGPAAQKSAPKRRAIARRFVVVSDLTNDVVISGSLAECARALAENLNYDVTIYAVPSSNALRELNTSEIEMLGKLL